ncbi:MAG: hypothetical protein PVG53_08260 [Holophagae bacterium]|jgi:hypothetical protein
MLRRSWFLWTVGVLLLVGCGAAPEPVEKTVTGPDWPLQVGGWSAADGPETYDTETIFQYIDGHAEVYLAYGMERCTSLRYVGPGGDGEIIADLFEVASPADAFGVFSHDRAGEPVAIGNDGVYRHGWLSFWQGPWVGSVYSVDGDDGSKDSVLEIGRALAAALPAGGETPALVDRLPTDAVDPQSVCFLRSPQILNAHVFVGSDNPFALGPDVEAVAGRLSDGDGRSSIVLVRYPSEQAAADVEARLRETASDDRPEMLVGRRGDLLAAAVGAVDEARARSLLDVTLGGGS